MKQIDVSQKVLDKIKTGRVKMKSRTVFALKKLGISGVFSLLLIIAISIISLVIFLIQQQSSGQLLELGGQAQFSFLSDLPWDWLAIVAIFILSAAVILRKFTLAYRKTLKRSAFGLFAAVMIIGGLLSLTGVHQGLAAKASELNIGFLKSVYQRALACDFDQEHLLIGKVISINKEEKTAEVITVGHQPMTVQLFSDTKVIDQPKIGDIFGAVGYKEDGLFYAQGLRKVTLPALKNRCLAEEKPWENQ